MVSVRFCLSSPGGTTSSSTGNASLGKDCTILTTTYEASRRANSSAAVQDKLGAATQLEEIDYSRPRHIRGPPLKGRYPQPIRSCSVPSSHLSGRNLSRLISARPPSDMFGARKFQGADSLKSIISVQVLPSVHMIWCIADSLIFRNQHRRQAVWATTAGPDCRVTSFSEINWH